VRCLPDPDQGSRPAGGNVRSRNNHFQTSKAVSPSKEGSSTRRRSFTKGSDQLNQIDLKTAEVPTRSETAFGRMTTEFQLGLTLIRHTRSTHN